MLWTNAHSVSLTGMKVEEGEDDVEPSNKKRRKKAEGKAGRLRASKRVTRTSAGTLPTTPLRSISLINPFHLHHSLVCISPMRSPITLKLPVFDSSHHSSQAEDNSVTGLKAPMELGVQPVFTAISPDQVWRERASRLRSSRALNSALERAEWEQNIAAEWDRMRAEREQSENRMSAAWELEWEQNESSRRAEWEQSENRMSAAWEFEWEQNESSMRAEWDGLNLKMALTFL